MKQIPFPLIVAALFAALPTLSAADKTNDPLAAWRSGVKVRDRKSVV